MAGIVFAKFTKPTMRAETILFSKNALITIRNGSFYMICRIADLRLVIPYKRRLGDSVCFCEDGKFVSRVFLFLRFS
jgi:hypothetical protein